MILNTTYTNKDNDEAINEMVGRPYGFFKKLKMKRIKAQMTYAAKNDKLFHLWWHPHNFGNDIESQKDDKSVLTQSNLCTYDPLKLERNQGPYGGKL